MQKVFIDTLTVPEESKPDFLARARNAQEFLKTLPGFVEGFLYEKTDGESPYNFVTTAIWESEEAFENAVKIVEAEYQKQGFNRKEIQKKLHIVSERAVYDRSPY